MKALVIITLVVLSVLGVVEGGNLRLRASEEKEASAEEKERAVNLMAVSTSKLPGLRGLQKSFTPPCTGDDRVECHSNGKKIAICHYDKELDLYETLCVAEQGASGQLKNHEKDYCGNCTETTTTTKDEIIYDYIPESNEYLPRCVNETQVCSGGEQCTDECIECVDRGTNMAIEMTVKLDASVSAYTFYSIEDVTGLTATDDQTQLISTLRESFPEYWELLGKEVTYKVCMKNVNWLNDPNPNSSQRDQISHYDGLSTFTRYKKANTTGNFDDGYATEYCLTSDPPLDFFDFVENGVFPPDKNYFSPPMAFKISSTRQYSGISADNEDDLDTGSCVKNVISTEFLTGRGTRVIVGGGTGGTEPEPTAEPSPSTFAPFGLPFGPDFSLIDVGCKEEFTLNGRFIELPGDKDISLYRDESLHNIYNRELWTAELYHPEVESMALARNPNASLAKTSVRFSVYAHVQSLRIFHDGCIIQPTVCHQNTANNRWYNVKMSTEKSKEFISNGDYEAGCDNYHTQQQMCKDYCGPPPNCKERSCAVNKLINNDGKEEFEIDCLYETVVCAIDADVDESTVQSICDESTNECILSCKNSSLICDDLDGGDCKCRSCRAPGRNMLISFYDITLASGIEHYIHSFDGDGIFHGASLFSSESFNMSKEELTSVLTQDFIEAASIISGTGVSLDVCMKDVDILYEQKRTPKFERDYGSVGKDYNLGRFASFEPCPSISYTMNYSSSERIAYLDALTGTDVAPSGLSSIMGGIDNTIFRVHTKRINTYTDGVWTEQCSELALWLEILGFAYDGYYKDNDPVYKRVFNSEQVASGERVWYPLPGRMGRKIFECNDAQITLDADGFIALPGSSEISYTQHPYLSFGSIICNHPSIIAALPTGYKPCVIFFTRTSSMSLKMIPDGC